VGVRECSAGRNIWVCKARGDGGEAKTANEKLYGLSQHYSCDQIKKNDMGGACSTYGRQERCKQSFGGET